MKARKIHPPKAAGLAKGRKPQASHPHFKRPKMSVMGQSAFGTPAMAGGGAPAFPADMGGAGALAGAGGAPMPPQAAPDNIAQ